MVLIKYKDRTIIVAKMARDQILVLYNSPILPPNHPEALAEHDILDTVHDVVNILEDGGYSVKQVGIANDPQPLIYELQRNKPKAVFNLYEGLPGRPYSEATVAALLEWIGVPFTGCPSISLALCANKVVTKHILKAMGLPTPRYSVINNGTFTEWNLWPAIVKPACQDASIGIEQENVVTNVSDMQKQVNKLIKRFGTPILIEEMIQGRELHVNIIQNNIAKEIEVLPAVEIVYPIDGGGLWPIYTFTGKWDETSDEYNSIDFEISTEINNEQLIANLGRLTFSAFYCRDYARIDIRLDQEGIPYILEINPNPYLNSITLVKPLELKGMTHAKLILDMVQSAITRNS